MQECPPTEPLAYSNAGVNCPFPPRIELSNEPRLRATLQNDHPSTILAQSRRLNRHSVIDAWVLQDRSRSTCLGCEPPNRWIRLSQHVQKAGTLAENLLARQPASTPSGSLIRARGITVSRYILTPLIDLTHAARVSRNDISRYRAAD
jgi:hypothetical protein